MKKRNVALLVAFACAVSMFVGAAAAELIDEIKAEIRRDFTVVVDGAERTFKNAQGDTVYPVLYEGTTYLPIRAIGELMGKKVYWYENEKRIELKDDTSTVTDADVIVGSTDAKTSAKETDNTRPQASADKTDTSAFISKERAQETALQKAGLSAADVVFDRTELDKDGGVWHYEVEFRQGRTEYDADVRATDGAILKWEVDKDD